MKIALGGDHGTLVQKQAIIDYLLKHNHSVVDYGTHSQESCDYSDFAYLAAKAVANKECDRAIVLCSTGIGVSISANKVQGIRCALVTSTKQAQLTREHNNTNALALGVLVTELDMILEIVDIWMTTAFSEDARHVRRIEKIEELGTSYELYLADTITLGNSYRDAKFPEDYNMAYYTTENKEAVQKNREHLFYLLRQPLANGVFPNQNHTNNVIKVTQADRGKGVYSDEDAIFNCDAIYTFDKDVVLSVFHADCVPVLIYDTASDFICAAHSSWLATKKGLINEVIKQARNENIDPSTLVAYVGAAALGQKATQADIEVFPFPVTISKNQVNVADIVVSQLKQNGVERIYQTSVATTTSPKYFSAQNKDTGRNLSFIYRKR